MSSVKKEPKKQTPRPTATEESVDCAEHVARLDQRINERANSSSSSSSLSPADASMSRVEQMVLGKRRNSANAKSSTRNHPGAFHVRDVEDRRSRLEQQMNSLEDRITAKTRAAPPLSSAPSSSSTPSSMSELEFKFSDKVSSGSGHMISTRSLDESISCSSKIRKSSATHPNLNDLENCVADEVRQETQDPPPSEDAREQLQALERLVATKNAQAQAARDRSLQSGFSDFDPLSTTDLAHPSSNRRQSATDVPEWDGQRGFSMGSGDTFGSSEWDHGVERASGSIAVAVAVPVEEDSEPIPSAVEYDPDAKLPIHRNRRFRLYGILAIILLALVAVGIGVGINVSKDDGYHPTKAFAHRENLGIREAVENVVGGENLEDISSPYSKALRWIMYLDPMELVPEAPNFMQRYILAYFYHATSVEKPWVSCNPPIDNDADSCLWDRIYFLDDLDDRVQVASFRWLSGAPECVWAGVFCDAFNQTRSISLWGSNMTGSFPTGVVHLPYLQSLGLVWGSLSGPLPKEIAEMKYLTSLRLQYNEFNGSIPEEWSKSRSLQLLDVGMNRLSGSISNTIQHLREIKQLFLSNNMITGTMPTSVGLLNGLSLFELNRNLLQGTIPSEIGLVGKSLMELWLHTNDLSGTIPLELVKAIYLERLYVSNNGRLSGEIPNAILPQLTVLEGYSCSFSGNFTSMLFNNRLNRLIVHNNNFTGQLPSDLGVLMPNIKELWISGNRLTGTIPDSICDLRAPLKLNELVADCAPSAESSVAEIVCPEGCCTKCCNPSGESCRTMN